MPCARFMMILLQISHVTIYMYVHGIVFIIIVVLGYRLFFSEHYRYFRASQSRFNINLSQPDKQLNYIGIIFDLIAHIV